MFLVGVSIAALGILFALMGVVYAVRTEGRFPATAAWLGLTVAAIVPMVTVAWHMQALSAEVAASDVQTKQLVMATGISTAIFTRAGVVFVLSLGFGAIATAGTLAALLSAGPESKGDASGLAGALVGGVAGTAACGALLAVTVGYDRIPEIGPAYLFLPPVAAVLALCGAASALRGSEQPTDRARAAAWRGFVGLASFLAIVLAAEVAVEMGVALSFQAVAQASAEMKQTLLMNGLATAVLARAFGWCVALIPACTAWGSAVGLVRDLGPRQRIGVAVATVQAVVILGFLGAAATPYAGFM